ncbi:MULTISPECIES: T6SS immunity protein Tli3 family protein [Tenebrionibacter/Tenebrionicola group]|jgi:hypothetical protein|uniref:Tli3-like domain-containing protein n=2 Tax=Tenebrionibacter/Tenebrionicola group TaxID=2969848 RepID=A0A8K0V4R5_9ENTR|nr:MULTISPECIES: hypothetical protein [Tenebrionibacter/Tenebrionicola group]MBK4717067.1 hypothetical protein [Tenebrionibacter intestinalis]MBV5097595.1 hypothetical protein [Tenebrionicola larvae]
MADNKDGTKTIVKLCAAGVVLIILGYVLIWFLFMPTIGGSFGAGFPSGSGGSRVRSVIIDVEPQVVYRIDKNRFFTLEKYKDCTHGGFVYYNDTRRGIKELVTSGATDKEPQDELDLEVENDVMAFKGKFIYSASDNVIAYPFRVRNYKYGGENYYFTYKELNDKGIVFGGDMSYSIYELKVTDGAVYIRSSSTDKMYKKFNTPNSGEYESIAISKVTIDKISQDNAFHCNNNIKPRSVKYN